jgi:hypothetical protein
MGSSFRFDKHYTREEARALLPEIQGWLRRLALLKERMDKLSATVERLMKEGHDRGGKTVEEYCEVQAEAIQLVGEFEKRQILVKDLGRGLIDFPAIIGGEEVFLCWEEGEEDIEFWHHLDDGYAGRERL